MATIGAKPQYGVATICAKCVHKSVCKYRDKAEQYEREYRTTATTVSSVIQLQINCTERATVSERCEVLDERFNQRHEDAERD